MAYGLATVRVVSPQEDVEIAEALRERGYGVTEMSGFGREWSVEILACVVQRAHLDEVIALVERWDPDAFVTAEEPTVLRGGSLVARQWKMTSPLGKWSGRPHQRA